MPARARELSEDELLSMWLDGELASNGVTRAQLEEYKPAAEPVQKTRKRRKEATPTVVDATCARITWTPGNAGRNWVCSDEEGKCQWCRDEEWHRYNRMLVDNHRRRVEQAERDAVPYGSVSDRPIARCLVDKLGGPVAAIEAVLDPRGPYGDFTGELPTLLAWELPYGEAIRRWHELLATAAAMEASRAVAPDR